MKKIFTLIVASALGFGVHAQSVTMNLYDHVTELDGPQIMSGDTIEIDANDSWEQYVNLHFNGVSTGDVNFRVLEILPSTCAMDQICGFLQPDPEFQGLCWSPNTTNYTTPLMTGINFAAGDTVIMKPLGIFTCGADFHMRYFVRLDGVELDSFDIFVRSTLSTPVKEKEVVDMTAYPNPANNLVTINTTGVDGEVEVKITDILGKVVYFETVSPVKKIDVSEFKNGVYLISVSENGKAIRTRRIVVKH